MNREADAESQVASVTSWNGNDRTLPDDLGLIAKQHALFDEEVLHRCWDLSVPPEEIDRNDIALRIAVLSDGHWGKDSPGPVENRVEPVTEASYRDCHSETVTTLTHCHDAIPIDLLVMNGDNVHNDEQRHEELLEALVDPLPFASRAEMGSTVFGVQGNHDLCTPDEWEAIYGHPKFHTFRRGRFGFVLASTGCPRSTVHDSEADPDVEFIRGAIDDFSARSDVDVVLGIQHIPPTRALSHGNEMNEVRAEWAREIVGAVCVGHSHDMNQAVLTVDGVRLIGTPLIGNTRVFVKRGVRIIDLVDLT